MNIERILVAVNSLNGRDAAFERGLAIAKSSGAELYLLHAVSLNQPFSFRGAERLRRMADMRQRAEDAAVPVQTVEQHGDAAEIIELHANAREADLIVMGGEARCGWRRSRSLVAEKVIRRTTVPTLVVPGDAAGASTILGSVLVAVDLSPPSEVVLRGALGLTAGQAVQLTVMHTVKGLEAADAVQSPARWKVPEFRAHVLDAARRTLERLVSDVAAGCGHTRARVGGVGRSRDSRTRRRPSRRSHRRGTQPRFEAAGIDGAAHTSPARPGAVGDPERGPSHESGRTVTRRLTQAATAGFRRTSWSTGNSYS